MQPRPWAKRVSARITHRRWRTPIAVGTIVTVAVVLEVTGLAAVPVPGATVIMKPLQANLSFGKAKAGDVAVDPESDFDTPPFVESLAEEPLRAPEVTIDGRPAASSCPDAGPLDFPDEPAGYDAKGLPAAGSYLWKEKGSVDLITPVPLSIKTGPYTTQQIRNVQRQPNGSWTYEYEWSTLLVGTEIDTINVVPGSGIFLTSLHFQPVSHDVAPVDFTPLQPVALVSLPVTVGGPAGSAVPAIDLQHQRVMTLTGTIDKRIRYDACGTVIEAWVVKNGQRTIQSLNNTLPEDNSTTFDFAFAPHLGGLIVALHRVGRGALGPITFTFDDSTSIGTLTPRPARSS